MNHLLIDYRRVRSDLRASVLQTFVAGTRVRLAGVQSSSWDATVVPVDSASERSMSADMVMLKFDNGNKFPVAIDEIEPITIDAERKPNAQEETTNRTPTQEAQRKRDHA